MSEKLLYCIVHIFVALCKTVSISTDTLNRRWVLKKIIPSNYSHSVAYDIKVKDDSSNSEKKPYQYFVELQVITQIFRVGL